jgi:hypothetical protein
MKSLGGLSITVILLIGFTPSARGQIAIRSGVPQLFVDDHFIEAQAGVTRTLHQPRKDHGGNEPVIALDNEFGGVKGSLQPAGSIVYDPRIKKHVMYALAYASSLPSPDNIRVYRFTSADAMNWVKGDDGRPEHIRFDLTDPATGRQPGGHGLNSLHFHPGDPHHPYKAWLFVYNWADLYTLEGLYYAHSSDGKKWQRLHQVADAFAMGQDTTYHEIRQDGRVLRGPGDTSRFSYDPLTNRFLGSFKFITPEIVPPSTYLRSRAYMYLDRIDQPIDFSPLQHVALVPAAAEANGDLPHDEYYTATAWRYGDLWLGDLKIWHAKGDYPYSAGGCAFTKLVSSRDGLAWKKVPFRNDAGHAEVFLANGPEGGNSGRNDGGYITVFNHPPLRIGDELIYYYGATSWGKNHPQGVRVTGGGIFRARLRVDGFVSVDAGTITTKPLKFDGRDLYLNGIGPIAVAVLDASGRVLGEATLRGDSLRHEVRFAGRRLRDVGGENALRLRFTLGRGEQRAELYSFTVAAEEGHRPNGR